jgi:hypothetical protein
MITPCLRSLRWAVPALGFLPLRAADAASEIKGFAPVSVSSAHYRNTPRQDLARAIDATSTALNPEAPPLRPVSPPQHFIFMPGEIYESDLTYEQVTGLLTPALAQKGYVNGADSLGIIREPTKVSLVLRVHYGVRPWRLPTVRPNDLAWSDGMVPQAKHRSLRILGGDQVWEHRAGGNDDSFAAIAANSANTQSFGFGSGVSQGGGGGADSAAAAGSLMAQAGGAAVGTRSIEYAATRDFHLIVVDAFDYQELKKKGKAAQRIWTTFISAPKEPEQKFSDLAATLIRNAVPYFGETTRGLQVYTDVRATVRIGELIEVKDEAKKSPP